MKRKSCPELPCLSGKSFNHLALSLLEQLVGHHGECRLKSSRRLDHRVMTFALHRLQSGNALRRTEEAISFDPALFGIYCSTP